MFRVSSNLVETAKVEFLCLFLQYTKLPSDIAKHITVTS